MCEIREVWLELTGDSYVVDVRPAIGSVASYLSKYMIKEAYERRLVPLGFKRSYSRSGNWPGGTLELAETREDNWVAHQFYGGKSKQLVELAEETEKHTWITRRVGDEMMLFMRERSTKYAKRKEIKRVVNLISFGSGVHAGDVDDRQSAVREADSVGL